MTRVNKTGAGVDQFDVRCARQSNRSRLLIASGITLIMAVGAVACASNGGTGGGSAAIELSPAAQSGEQLSRSKGCAGCHGQNFEGGAGPGWIGLAGSEVTLVDGVTVIADDAYLTAAVADPAKDLVDGYTLKMPANNLTDAEVADIVAYITALAGE
jgi:cytochrome c1